MGLPVSVIAGVECDDLQLGQQITLLSAQINVANYRLLKLIAEFDLRGAWRCETSVRSCAHWLAAHCGMAIGAAREKVRVARRLAGLPEVSQGFSTGELSYSKVRAITRVATESNESLLVTMAERSSASHLEKLVGKYKPIDELGSLVGGAPVTPAKLGPVVGVDDRGAVESVESGSDTAPAAAPTEVLDEVPDQAPDEEAHREHAREMYWFQDKEGMWVIHARLPPEQGQLVMKALEAVARPLQEERIDDWKAKQKERMQAVARSILRKQRGEVADIPASVEFSRAEEKISAETFSQFMNQVRADAFSAMAEHFLATSSDVSQLQGLKGAERCQVVLHVDINTLREQRSGVCCTHAQGYFEDKPWLSPKTARRLSCDASLVTVLEDDKGAVLNVGRRSRTVPAHIRRALLERDGVCRYPGCHESRYVDAHHIEHWAEGGETSLDNLVTLCRFHHRQLHRGGYGIQLDAEGRVVVQTEGEG